jgi:hypothetical protein
MMAMRLSQYAVLGYPAPVFQATDSGFSATTRLAFYISYYVLNVCFAAELFSVLLTLPVFIICCFGVSRIRSSYATVQDMAWLVIYMFFVVATCQTLRSGYFDGESPVNGLYFENYELITAEFIVLLFLLVTSVTTIVVMRYYQVQRAESYDLGDRGFFFLITLSVFSFVMFVIFMNGLDNVLADRYSRVSPEELTPIATACLALQSIACLLACVCMKGKPRSPFGSWFLKFWLCVLSVVLLLVAQNPYNSARFMLLITYVPILLVLCSGRIRVSMFYPAALAGLLVLMPILNFTSRFGMSISAALEQINISEYIFKVPYLDVFDTLVYEVRYMQSTELFWGGKTLGALLFFVPRAIWTGKETLIGKDMGAQLVDLKAAGTDNLSLFFAGEFYADWGLLGVAIGAFVVALLLTIFGLKRKITVNGLDLRSFIVMAAAPIIIRGPIAAVIMIPFLELVFLAALTRLLCRRTAADGGAPARDR